MVLLFFGQPAGANYRNMTGSFAEGHHRLVLSMPSEFTLGNIG
jgi:hypothetical protein